jgi:hypothetical protein
LDTDGLWISVSWASFVNFSQKSLAVACFFCIDPTLVVHCSIGYRVHAKQRLFKHSSSFLSSGLALALISSSILFAEELENHPLNKIR